MSNAPHYSIDPNAFWADPYPDLARMRAESPVAFVPELGATLLTRRDSIAENEKDNECILVRSASGIDD